VDAHIKKVVDEGMKYLSNKADVQEAEVFASVNAILTSRINYTSHLPCNGLEEPKSTQTHGVSLRVVLKEADGVKVGFGQETGSLTSDAIESAYRKAREGAVHDPDFHALPSPSQEERVLWNYHDEKVLTLSDKDLVTVGWKAIHAALEEYERSPLIKKYTPDELGLILGGDVTIIQEAIAIASTHLQPVQEDTSTIIFSSLTSMIEKINSKGSGWSVGTHLDDCNDEAGKMAVQSALHSVEGRTIESGSYPVILGPQAVADIVNNILIPSLRLDIFYAGNSTYQGKLGEKVTSEILSIYDNGSGKGLAASKGITCEGLPTGKTELITNGRLSGLLSNDYETKRILRDEKAQEKLGVDPLAWQTAIAPRNGFRFGQGGGRNHASLPSISPTNVIIEGNTGHTLEELLQKVTRGIYVGRIWYTYPINGIKAGDFTATIVGDSYLIKDGRLSDPLQPNTVRINDTIHSVCNHLMGVENKQTGVVLWAADEVIYAPHMALSQLKMSKIAESVQSL
jgi:PmbA protein